MKSLSKQNNNDQKKSKVRHLRKRPEQNRKFQAIKTKQSHYLRKLLVEVAVINAEIKRLTVVQKDQI